MDKDDRQLLWVLGLTVGVIVIAYWFVTGGADSIGLDDDSSLGYAINSVGDTLADLTSTEEGRLEKLEPTTQSLVRQLLDQLASQGTTVYVGSTIRTVAQEKADVAAGKSSKGQVYSWHNLGRAVDLYPVNPDTGKPDYNGVRYDLFSIMASVATSLGFRSLAYNADGSRHYLNTVKGPIWDGGHLEYHGPYSSLSEAIAAEGSDYGIT
jgi:hypothetical protein